MKDLIILGVGVHAGEMAEIVERVSVVKPTWNLLGYFVSKKGDGRVGGTLNGYPILGTSDDRGRFPDASFVPAYGYGDVADIPHSRLTTLIDQSAVVSRTARIGNGCVIYPNCFVGLNATLGDRVFVLSGCVISHDDVIEDDVSVASGVKLAGNLHVESGCYLGQGCTVRQNVRVGRNSMLGMGCVVVKDVPPNTVMVGNPGRKLRERSPS